MNYQDKFFSKYVSTHFGQIHGGSYLENIKKQLPAWENYITKFLPKEKNVKIIDLGCGNGEFLYWLQKSDYKNAEGIDISGEQVEAAEKNGVKNVQKSGILEFIKDKREFYDVIFMRDVIEHIKKENILDILEAVRGSLKKDGLLIIQTINGESPFSGRSRYNDFTHEVSFARHSMHQILLLTGFREIDIVPLKPAVHGLKSLVRSILWYFIELIIKFYLLVETGSSSGMFTLNLLAVAKK